MDFGLVLLVALKSGVAVYNKLIGFRVAINEWK